MNNKKNLEFIKQLEELPTLREMVIAIIDEEGGHLKNAAYSAGVESPTLYRIKTGKIKGLFLPVYLNVVKRYLGGAGVLFTKEPCVIEIIERKYRLNMNWFTIEHRVHLTHSVLVRLVGNHIPLTDELRKKLSLL